MHHATPEHQELNSVLKRQCINAKVSCWGRLLDQPAGSSLISELARLSRVTAELHWPHQNRGVTVHQSPTNSWDFISPFCSDYQEHSWCCGSVSSELSFDLTTPNSLGSAPGPLWAPQPELCCYSGQRVQHLLHIPLLALAITPSQKIKRTVKSKGSEFYFIFYFFKFMRAWILIN